eukprot:m.36121 g.36121  ORF g.36121 m.36121 type:complete len:76 (-) comp5760_c0_seq1:3705-3932(-)
MPPPVVSTRPIGEYGEAPTNGLLTQHARELDSMATRSRMPFAQAVHLLRARAKRAQSAALQDEVGALRGGLSVIC